jgi:hypothetical protein
MADSIISAVWDLAMKVKEAAAGAKSNKGQSNLLAAECEVSVNPSLVLSSWFSNSLFRLFGSSLLVWIQEGANQRVVWFQYG